ncbi:MAG: C40 family peptidase [Alphaproteobacteria bacterium]|nr:C40 family peptidase [Alphaproteobacteria bacterium]
MVEAVDIVMQARSWVGTRFQHQGRLKKTTTHPGGCDCLGLLMGVARELDLRSTESGRPLTEYDRTDYGRSPDGEAFRSILGVHLQRVTESQLRPGDVGLFMFDANPQHVAIISDAGLIHSYAQIRKVAEHGFTDAWKKRLVAVFRSGT